MEEKEISDFIFSAAFGAIVAAMVTVLFHFLNNRAQRKFEFRKLYFKEAYEQFSDVINTMDERYVVLNDISLACQDKINILNLLPDIDVSKVDLQHIDKLLDDKSIPLKPTNIYLFHRFDNNELKEFNSAAIEFNKAIGNFDNIQMVLKGSAPVKRLDIIENLKSIRDRSYQLRQQIDILTKSLNKSFHRKYRI